MVVFLQVVFPYGLLQEVTTTEVLNTSVVTTVIFMVLDSSHIKCPWQGFIEPSVSNVFRAKQELAPLFSRAQEPAVGKWHS